MSWGSSRELAPRMCQCESAVRSSTIGSLWRKPAGSLDVVSDAASHHQDEVPHGTRLLPRDLTDEEFAALPVLESLDQLEIDDLTDDEYEKFIAALSS